MTFIDNLEAVTAPTINTTLYNDSSNILVNMISNTNVMTDGLWFVWSILALWIFLIYTFMRKDETFLLDLPRAMLVSSGWCLMISIGAAVTTLTTNIVPIIWFSSLVFIFGLIVLKRVEKGL